MNSPLTLLALMSLTGLIPELHAIPQIPLEANACHAKCFEAKRSCNDSKSIASGRNSCGDEMLVCRQSCATKRPMNQLDPQPLMNVSFRPILKDLF